MILMLETALIISLFTCGLNILFRYDEGFSKRYQMIFYRFRKKVYDKRKEEEELRDLRIKEAKEYYRNAINLLDYINCEQNVVDSKVSRYNQLEDAKIKEINEDFEKALSYEWYLKPIFLCVYCMPSFWGTIVWVALFGFSNPIQWAITLVISVFFNSIIWNIHEKYDTI